MPTKWQKAVGKPEVTRSTREKDRTKAEIKALVILHDLHEEWREIHRQSQIASKAAILPKSDVPDSVAHELVRTAYEQTRELAEVQRRRRYQENPKRSLAGLEERAQAQAQFRHKIQNDDLSQFEGMAAKRLAEAGYPLLPDDPKFREYARIIAMAVADAMDVENRMDRGEIDPKPSSDVVLRAQQHALDVKSGKVDMPFSTLVEEYLRMWKAESNNKKETNTEQQKRAVFKLFSEFSGDRPVRFIKENDAASFYDQLKLLNPDWARSPSLRELTWSQLLETCGGHARGLSASTMNRHIRTLKHLWKWAQQRGHCDGRNPFEGFSKRLRIGENARTYLPWEADELNLLFSPPPKRSDLLEVVIVAMFSGMRLDEIASLTWGRIRTSVELGKKVTYFQVVDAKTPAGVRDVPVHSTLSWLLDRPRGGADDRVWPKFNCEGVGRKAGADAGREFSTFKIKRGFSDRQKAFHSFRKNVTRIMERAGVPEGDWAQVLGHERGFTYGRYNPDGITLARKAEIIELISYAGVKIPFPA